MKLHVLTFILLSLCNLQSFGQTRLPERPVQKPQPILQDEAQPLLSDELFVIDSDVPLIIKQFPKGRVSIEEDAGPIKIKGKFIYGNGVKQTKTFQGKHVYQLTGVFDGRVDVIAIPTGIPIKNDSLIEFSLQVATGTDPPPGPTPTPTPTPVPIPIPVDGLHVLMIYEQMDSAGYPVSQQSVLYGKTVRNYLDAKCPKDYRIWDKDTVVTAESKKWQDMMKRERKSVPWIIISNGKTSYEGPLPTTVKDAMELLEKYGGKQ